MMIDEPRPCRHCGGTGETLTSTVPDLVWDVLQVWVWQTADDVVRRIHRIDETIAPNTVWVTLARMAKRGEIIAESTSGQTGSGNRYMYRRPNPREATTV